MGNIDISGTSHEIPELPRAQELADIFKGASNATQWTYDDKVTGLFIKWKSLSNMTLREQTVYKTELQLLIDEIRSTVINPNRSPATSRATSQEIVQLLERRTDKNRPHIQWAITRLSHIDLSNPIWLDNNEREYISLKLWELLVLIQSDISWEKSQKIYEEVGEVKEKYDEYITSRIEATNVASRETADENFEIMLQRAREISLDGRIDKTDWGEVLPRMNQEFDAMWISISPQDEMKLKNFVNTIKKSSESAEVWLHSIDAMLEDMLWQAESADRSGPVEIIINKKSFLGLDYTNTDIDPLVYARNFMHNIFPERVDAWASGDGFKLTFENREQVVELVYWIKDELSEMQKFDAIDTISDVVFTALYWAGAWIAGGVYMIDWVILDAAIADFNISTSHIAALVVSVPLHIWWVWAIKNKLRIANSGVSSEIVQWLTNNLRETIKLYEEAGFKAEEIKNMKVLLDSITLNLPETPEGINDLQFRARYIYIQLQKWRWNPLLDQVRFSAAEVWKIMDSDFRVTPTSRLDNGTYTWNFASIPVLRDALSYVNWIPLVWFASRNIERYVWAHLWLGSLASRLINKWPNWRFGWWWVLYTKSEAISDNADELWRTNKKIRQMFDVIDWVVEFSSDKKTELKREVMEVYGWGEQSKLDPLRAYNYELWLIGSDTRTNLYIQLEAELAREGVVMEIKSPTDFHRWMQALSTESAATYKSLLRSYITIPRVRVRTDDQAANILRDAIRTELGYVPEWLQEMLNSIRENTRKFEIQRESVEKARVEFMNFIEFYPAISDEQEIQLTSIANIEKNSAETPEAFRTNMNRILWEHFDIHKTPEEIRDFLKKVTTESIRTWEKRANAKILEEIEQILRAWKEKWHITETQFTERMANAEHFFQWDRTLWQPHLGLIVEDIITGNFTNWTNTIPEVQDFIDRWWKRDIFSQLKELKRQATSIEVKAVDSPAPIIPWTRTPETTTETKIWSEWFTWENPWAFGFEVLKLEILMNPGIDVDLSEVLSKQYASQDVAIQAVNDTLSSVGLTFRLNVMSKEELLSLSRAYAEDSYRRLKISTWEDISNTVIWSIRASETPMKAIWNIDISSIPEWTELTTNLSPDEISLLQDAKRWLWKDDKAIKWREILEKVRKAST